MTREEAIAYGKRVIDLGLNDETQAFCELSIKALEQEPCDDAISREAVLKCFTLDNTKADVWNNIKALPKEPCTDAISRQAVLEKAICVPIARVVTEDKVIYRKIVFVDEIENIPPVNPAEKVGQWIIKMRVNKKIMVAGIKTWYLLIICDKCGFIKTIMEEHKGQYKFCPNCGQPKIQEVNNEQ